MAQNDPAIRVRNISKKYRLGGRKERYSTLRDAIASSIVSPFQRGAPGKPADFLALDRVSFEVEPGEVVGIIGKNGAGKSTLLKIISRITLPSEGCIGLRGRVGSLLEVGTGFHPELTGRENVFLSGSILGMKKREIEDRFDEIVRFSEVGKFIDTPLKRYSSGMQVRLGFAVAAHLDPEILLVDEVLAVGDAAFQKRCFHKMDSVSNEGRTILLVSHNMTAIQAISQRAIVLHAGRKVVDSTPDEAIAYYLSDGAGNVPAMKTYPESSLPGDEYVRLKSVRAFSGTGSGRSSISIPDDICIEIIFAVLKNITGYHNYVRISSESGLLLFASGDWDGRNETETSFTPGTYKSTCIIRGNLLNSGTFLVSVLGQIPHKRYLFVEEHILKFEVNELHGAGGIYSVARPGFFRPVLDWNTECMTDPSGRSP